ncbi:unnamed protein product, partial [Closterium sp. NIES-53]
ITTVPASPTTAFLSMPAALASLSATAAVVATVTATVAATAAVTLLPSHRVAAFCRVIIRRTLIIAFTPPLFRTPIRPPISPFPLIVPLMRVSGFRRSSPHGPARPAPAPSLRLPFRPFRDLGTPPCAPSCTRSEPHSLRRRSPAQSFLRATSSSSILRRLRSPPVGKLGAKRMLAAAAADVIVRTARTRVTGATAAAAAAAAGCRVVTRAGTEPAIGAACSVTVVNEAVRQSRA